MTPYSPSSVRVTHNPEGGSGYLVDFTDHQGYHSKLFANYEDAIATAKEIAYKPRPIHFGTKEPSRDSAVYKCRVHGWRPGTQLRNGNSVIEITGMGEEKILAKYLKFLNGASATHLGAEMTFGSLEHWSEYKETQS